jgi:hypothetical protein
LGDGPTSVFAAAKALLAETEITVIGVCVCCENSIWQAMFVAIQIAANAC